MVACIVVADYQSKALFCTVIALFTVLSLEERWVVGDSRKGHCPTPVLKDGNEYPRLDTRWIFTPLRYYTSSIFYPLIFLLGKKPSPSG
jgi:hypothetical protein